MVLTIMSLKKVLEKLPQYEFIRVHRSYVVPLKRIAKATINEAFIIIK